MSRIDRERSKRYKIKVRFVLEYELDDVMADSPEEAECWVQMTEIEEIAGLFEPSSSKIEILSKAIENPDYKEDYGI